jgi:PRC-barrel domain
MLKYTLMTSALATLLVSGSFAQTEPGADPAQDAPAQTQEAPAADPTAPPAVMSPETGVEGGGATGDAVGAMPGERAPVDVSTVSAEQLIGADIQTVEGETIASVADVVLTENGQIESFVAQFGGVLGFGSNKVELTPDELQFMQEAGGLIIAETSLTPESLEGRPDYVEPNAEEAADPAG